MYTGRSDPAPASFQEQRYSEAAESILECGLATEVVQRIGSGKEADVYSCVDGPMWVAVKVYRLYRTSHRGGGPVKQESMGHQAAHELEMLTRAWRGRARVPERAVGREHVLDGVPRVRESGRRRG